MRGLALACCMLAGTCWADDLVRLPYRHPGLVVDLEVGLWAWPLPMDYDQDGDLDLVVSCPDKPSNGTYFFENAGQTFGSRPHDVVFLPGRRIGPGLQNLEVSFVEGEPRVLGPGVEYTDFRQHGLERPRTLPVPANVHQLVGTRSKTIRANQWKYVDYDADGRLDLLIGVDDWSDYGWDDAYDTLGRWRHGPLHGYVYWLRNTGTNEEPNYAPAKVVEATSEGELSGRAAPDAEIDLHHVLSAGRPVDVFGWPSPNLADFDGDGDLDLLCGEFLDGFTYFPNLGTRSEPRFGVARRLMHEGRPLTMDLQMITPVAVDWDADGDPDLVVGDEDGRVAWMENRGETLADVPQFLPPVYFRQQAEAVGCGALATPCGFDWDGDGDEDIISGNTAGYILFIENLGDPDPTPRFAAPRQLEVDGRPIRIQAGVNGSIQGPCEAKWGYTTLTVGDWDHDELPDLVVNSIWGRVVWFRNLGPRNNPRLAPAEPILVDWPAPQRPPKPAWTWWSPAAGELVTQWRTTPVVVDWDEDGLNDLVMLDHEGYLALFRRNRVETSLRLGAPERVFVDSEGQPLRLNAERAGRSGRRKLAVVDWDGDGRLDLLVNGPNADWYRNLGLRDGRWRLEPMGRLAERELASHTTSPTTVDWDGDGIRDLLVGAEDGFLYYMRNPRAVK